MAVVTKTPCVVNGDLKILMENDMAPQNITLKYLYILQLRNVNPVIINFYFEISLRDISHLSININLSANSIYSLFFQHKVMGRLFLENLC